jgi:hypothetical protein
VDVAGFSTAPLKYPYKQVPLPNGSLDWLPILRLQVARGSSITSPFEGIIDSGAFDCLFHADIARAVGISDIATGDLKISGGVVKGVRMNTYGHDIRMVVGSDSSKIHGYFSEFLPIACLLGRNGFFDKYRICFDPSGPAPGFELTRVRKK